MRQRTLFATGVLAIAAAAALGIAGFGVGWLGFGVGQAISMDRAQQLVQSFLDRRGDPNLKIDELLEFDRNFYALVKEKDTGIGAFELLVNRTTGAVYFEPGPDMMWNAKYGMMGRAGHMGFWAAAGAMSVTPESATTIAQRWLDAQGSGYSAASPDAFYGYYTFHYEKDGKIAGMLSVNGSTGQVWYHSWHGAFVQARQVG